MNADHLLEIRNLRKEFGGIVAVDNVSYELDCGDANGIIGTNGAGKTTLFNLITGLHSPTSGSVLYQGRDITKYPSFKRTSLGLIRTFQLASVFENLSVIENLVLSCTRFSQYYSSKARFFCTNKRTRKIRDGCMEYLSKVNLQEKSNVIVKELSYGDKRKLEMAISLSLNPVVLFLDEPFAGLSEEEIDEITVLLSEVKEDTTLLIIEHKISKLSDIVDRLTVMHEGKVVADGLPAEVLNRKDVRRIYWGEEE